MALPVPSELAKLNVSYNGTPFVESPVGASVTLVGMNVSYNGVPFVRNEGVAAIPTDIVVANIELLLPVDGVSTTANSSVTTASIEVATEMPEIGMIIASSLALASLEVVTANSTADLSVSASFVVANIEIGTSGSTSYDPIFVDGNLAVQLDEDQYMKM